MVYGLSQPCEQRGQQLRTSTIEYTKLVVVVVVVVDGLSGVNDAIPLLACHRWRVQQSFRMFQWALDKREQGQAIMTEDPFE